MLDAVLWLREHASASVALQLVDAVEDSVELLVTYPLAGSGWVGTRLGIPELRSFPAGETGYVLYYLATGQGLEILRVLHGRRDIDAELIAP